MAGQVGQVNVTEEQVQPETMQMNRQPLFFEVCTYIIVDFNWEGGKFVPVYVCTFNATGIVTAQNFTLRLLNPVV